MSDVVGSGWIHVTFLRTVGFGSPGLVSLTPLSGGGSGPSRVLFFVILHLWSFSSDEDLPYGSLLLWLGGFTLLLEPVTGFFLAG